MLDLRDIDNDNMEKIVNVLKDKTDEIASKFNLDYSIERKGETEPIQLPDHIVKTIKESAETCEIDYKMMTSGALHDSCVLGKVTDVGMIFVPSIDGRSHVPEEETALKDITLGAEVLLETIIKLSSNDR
jgi:acetylornithine deacetylase/succinyl-diaminopimelate desuccinylase-like protein